MIIGKPVNINFFLAVDSDKAMVLNQKGFVGAYRDGEFIYFPKTKTLIKTVEELWQLKIK